MCSSLSRYRPWDTILIADPLRDIIEQIRPWDTIVWADPLMRYSWADPSQDAIEQIRPWDTIVWADPLMRYNWADPPPDTIVWADPPLRCNCQQIRSWDTIEQIRRYNVIVALTLSNQQASNSARLLALDRVEWDRGIDGKTAPKSGLAFSRIYYYRKSRTERRLVVKSTVVPQRSASLSDK